MSKAVTRYVCQDCGAVLSKWMGQCEACGAWNSVVEEVVQKRSSKISVPDNFFKIIDDFGIRDEASEGEALQTNRKITGINELNRVLGGGFVDGSVVLVGGPPGIGKSTLLLQVLLSGISGIENNIYFSAEESVMQVGLRASRLRQVEKKVMIANSNNIEQIVNSLSRINRSSIVIIDSIQTISTDLIHSAPGTISQVRYCTQELVNLAKKNNITIVIVGHITKDGSIAGPMTLEHMVDCVLYFEGDKSYDYRILRVSKNRYGPTDEIGVFSMTGAGLEEVSNPSAAFLSEHESLVSGVAVFAGIEGTRPILSEIQALVSNTNVAMPRRSSIGFDSNRLTMLVAVLSNRCRLNFSSKDVYLNVAGGLKISEPAVDFAVVSSIMSAYFNKPLPLRSVFFGEVSLSGDIRQAHLSYSRIKEACKLGFDSVYCSYKTEDFTEEGTVNISRVKSVRDMAKIIAAIDN
ncbi:MAG: DNA repair protein RadA [Holosporales bacterium]|nr:DNA repair protein RadA [Holosporales bacterium]